MSSCAQCASTDMIRIAMTLDGGPVEFCHCRRCEHRQWHSAESGRSLRLPDVLHRVAG